MTFSPSITDIANRKTCTFFSDKTYRTWHKIGYYVPIFPPGALFCPFFVSFFLITSMSSNLSVSISISRHVFKFAMPWKAISPYEKRIMNDIQDGEASSVADRSREHVEPVLPMRKIAFWIERTLVTTYLFPFPLRVRNNRVSLYIIMCTGPILLQLKKINENKQKKNKTWPHNVSIVL